MNLGILFRERSEVRVVLPEFRTRTPHIGKELAWVPMVQVPHGSREHHNISRRQTAPQD